MIVIRKTVNLTNLQSLHVMIAFLKSVGNSTGLEGTIAWDLLSEIRIRFEIHSESVPKIRYLRRLNPFLDRKSSDTSKLNPDILILKFGYLDLYF